jgi:hypothetical protein
MMETRGLAVFAAVLRSWGFGWVIACVNLQLSLMDEGGNNRDDLTLPKGTEDAEKLAKQILQEFEDGKELSVTVLKVLSCPFPPLQAVRAVPHLSWSADACVCPPVGFCAAGLCPFIGCNLAAGAGSLSNRETPLWSEHGLAMPWTVSGYLAEC